MPAKFPKDFIQGVYRNNSLPARAILCILFLGVAASFAFFQPHIRSLITGTAGKNNRKETFVQSLQADRHLDLKAFWEFREQYSPGSFTFDSGVSFLGTQVIQKLPEFGSPLHTFSAPQLESRDFLVPREQKSVFLEEKLAQHPQQALYYSDDYTTVFLDKNGNTVLVFWQPIEALYTVDGLFDFTEAERKLLADQVWINVTIFQ